MRKVKFECLNGAPDYDQFGGRGLFKDATIAGAECVALFDIGDQDPLPAAMTDYVGAWPVDTRPTITITSVTCVDPSFFYDALTGLIAVKSGTPVTMAAAIANFPVAASWNTPLYRNGQIEGYIATETDGSGNITFDTSEPLFPYMGLWELTEENINKGLPADQHFKLTTNITAKVS